VGQFQVELANAEEQVQQSVSSFRLNAASLRTRLNLSAEGSITLNPLLQGAGKPGYREGAITALDLMQNFRRSLDTAGNLRDAYLGWRRAEGAAADALRLRDEPACAGALRGVSGVEAAAVAARLPSASVGTPWMLNDLLGHDTGIN
jgi:hypothetical protein